MNIGYTELLLLLIIGAMIVLPTWMLIDCATKETETGSKIAWVLTHRR